MATLASLLCNFTIIHLFQPADNRIILIRQQWKKNFFTTITKEGKSGAEEDELE